MATKRYNQQTFSCRINGRDITFMAYTTDTRNGFCHTVTTYDFPISDTKVSYLNRTWERFDYETCLKRAIEKITDKDMAKKIRDVLIDGKAEEEHEKAEAFIGAFTTAYSQLSDKGKESLAKAVGEDGLQNKEQAEAALAMAQLGAIIGA